MTQTEYNRLNPPFKIGDVANTKEWLYVGHVPTPTTRIGWFVYNVIHGLAMRYRLLPVLSFSLSEFLRNSPDREVSLVADDSEGSDLWCDYDDVTNSLLIFFYGEPVPNYVNWINDKVATLHDEADNSIVGVMIDKYKDRSLQT